MHTDVPTDKHTMLTGDDARTHPYVDTPRTGGAGQAVRGQIAVNVGDPMTDNCYASVTMSGIRLTAAQQQVIASMVRAYPKHCIVITCYHDRRRADWTPTALYDDVVEAVGRAADFWYWGSTHLGITFAHVDGGRGRSTGTGNLVLDLTEATAIETYLAQDGGTGFSTTW